MIADRGCVFRMKRIGPSTEPRGTPYNKEDGSDSRPRSETICFLPLRYDPKNTRALSRIPKTYLKRFSSRSWSIVSNAALRSRRVETEMWSESLLGKRSLKTRSRAVTVLYRDRYADWKTCHKFLRSRCTSSWERKHFFPTVLTQVWSFFFRMLGSIESFFRRGLTMVCFNESGTEPVERQALTMSVKTGAKRGKRKKKTIKQEI